MKRLASTGVPRRVFWVAFALAALPLAAQVRDVYLVANANAEFYQNRRRAQFSLAVGDMVEGEAHPAYRDWLRVTVAGQTYDARASHFLSRAAVIESHARQRAEALARIQRYSDRIARNREQMWQLHSAIAAIGFDSTIQFREEVLVPIPPPERPEGNDRPEERDGERRPPQRPQFRVEYRHTDKIASSRARRETRRWQADIEALMRDTSRAVADRRQDLARLAANEAENLDRERRLRQFAETRENRSAEPHLALARTGLYDGQRLVGELPEGEIVLALPNERHSNWLRVQAGDRVYDARSEHLASRASIEREDAVRLAQLRQLAADLEGDIELAVNREALLRSLCVSLRYESQVSRVPLASHPFPADYPGRRFYAGGAAPQQVVEVVNASRARSVLRDWEKELAEVQAALDRLRQRFEEVRVEAAVGEARAEERSRRFQPFDPAGRSASPVRLFP